MKNFLKKYWISIFLCLIIVYLCLIKMSSLPRVNINNFDKFVHCLMSMGLSGIIYFEQTHYFRKKYSVGNILLSTWLFPVLFMGGIELAQEYLPVSRTGDWIDFFYDSLGSTLGFLICLLINRRL